jgi:Na+(H+)/acetate symporter ActP
MNNWIPALLNTGRKQNIFKMFGRRRNNRGMMWASLLGLGVSAAAYGLRKNQNRDMLRPVQNVMNNIRTQTAGNMPNVAAITEFAKELIPETNSLRSK